MSYQESLRRLNTHINFERLQHAPHLRWNNLRRVQEGLRRLGHPDRKYTSIIIAGTKGKGTTGFYLQSLLEAHGISTGFFSSPHLETPRERIRIRGKEISKRRWCESFKRVEKITRSWPEQLGPLSYFEYLTLMAAVTFASSQIEFGIFEVGMGGRLDASNAIDAEYGAITRIDFDHEEWLGNSLAKIAAEKAAIARKGMAMVSVPQERSAAKQIEKQVKAKSIPLMIARPIKDTSFGLVGEHQRINAGAAYAIFKHYMEQKARRLKPTSIEKVWKKKEWPGRFEVVRDQRREWILDVAHNPASIQALLKTLNKGGLSGRLLFAVSSDKKAEEMLRLLSKHFDDILLTTTSHPRMAKVESLMQLANPLFRKVTLARSPEEAIRIIRINDDSKRIIVTGSFYLVGACRKVLKNSEFRNA